MKRVVSLLSLGFALLLLSAPTASAENYLHTHNDQCDHGSGGGTSVPELDPGAGGMALALLIGGALLLGGRRRQRG